MSGAPLAALRLLDDLLWRMRREGVMVATSTAIDAARAVTLVGLGDRTVLRETLAAVLVQRSGDRTRFERAFDAFFGNAATGEGTSDPHVRSGDLWSRLSRELAPDELVTLRDILRARAAQDDGAARLLALLHGGSELDGLLAQRPVRTTLSAVASPSQRGFYTHRVLELLGVSAARRQLTVHGTLGLALRGALGERGEHVAAVLQRELDATAAEVRAHIAHAGGGAQAGSRATGSPRVMDLPFAMLDAAEAAQVRAGLRELALRLRASARIRERRWTRGRLDVHASLRAALRTGGVPMRRVHRKRRPSRPRLWLLCDVSESVRAASTFMLELVAAAHELFERTRSFVFVSDLVETSELFARGSTKEALAALHAGRVVALHANSSYARALSVFEAGPLAELDRRTTVVVLGDGRTNYQGDGARVLALIRQRARALVWLCPEPRSAWAQGDSAMRRYEALCTYLLEVRAAGDLERAARLLMRLR